MLGFVTTSARAGASERLLAVVAARLERDGVRLAGALQHNAASDGHTPGDMTLRLLGSGAEIPISQRLGAGARGCRLSPDGLERAVGQAAAALDAGADLLIVNKFGKQEAQGRGFQPLIGQAVAARVPVLTTVSPTWRGGFDAFAGGLADEIAPEPNAAVEWCLKACAEAAHNTKKGAARAGQ